MKKAILISIRPEWVEKILNGEKTIEIRKSMPKCELPIDVYIYCSNPNKYRLWRSSYRNVLNGKVVAKFTLNKVEKFKVEHLPLLQEMGYINPYTLISFTGNLKTMYLEQNSCLLLEDVYKYAQNENVFAWHIENLQIFDKPMELSEFYYICQRSGQCFCKDYFNRNNYHKLIGDDERGLCNKWLNVLKAPQSWQYVYGED